MAGAFRARIQWLTLCLGLLAGCGESAPARVCVPGAQQGCACADGGQGAQVCKDDGSGFGACFGCTGGSSDAGVPEDLSASSEDMARADMPRSDLGDLAGRATSDGGLPLCDCSPRTCQFLCVGTHCCFEDTLFGGCAQDPNCTAH